MPINVVFSGRPYFLVQIDGSSAYLSAKRDLLKVASQIIWPLSQINCPSLQ